jgi:hypothetical protein
MSHFSTAFSYGTVLLYRDLGPVNDIAEYPLRRSSEGSSQEYCSRTLTNEGWGFWGA